MFIFVFFRSTIEKEQLHVVYITQDKQRDLFEMLTNRGTNMTCVWFNIDIMLYNISVGFNETNIEY